MPLQPSEQVARQIRQQVEWLRWHRWRVFEGAEALQVLRSIIYLKQKPIVMAHCERGPELGAHTYEYFLPSSGNHDLQENVYHLHGTLGGDPGRISLCWHPERKFHESGTYVSYVSTLPEYFPRDEYDKLVLPAIEFQHASSEDGVPAIAQFNG